VHHDYGGRVKEVIPRIEIYVVEVLAGRVKDVLAAYKSALAASQK
jgi:hypothetical protein